MAAPPWSCRQGAGSLAETQHPGGEIATLPRVSQARRRVSMSAPTTPCRRGPARGGPQITVTPRDHPSFPTAALAWALRKRVTNDPGMRAILREFLAREGFEVAEEPSAERAPAGLAIEQQ